MNVRLERSGAIRSACSRSSISWAVGLADVFCREARLRVNRLFGDFYGKNDGAMYRLAQQVMRGEHAWLESGIISLVEATEASEVDEELVPLGTR